jgi:hypothetical protein
MESFSPYADHVLVEARLAPLPREEADLSMGNREHVKRALRRGMTWAQRRRYWPMIAKSRSDEDGSKMPELDAVQVRPTCVRVRGARARVLRALRCA